MSERIVRIKKSDLDAAFHREREVGIVLGQQGHKVCPTCAKKIRPDSDEEAHAMLDAWFGHVETCEGCPASSEPSELNAALAEWVADGIPASSEPSCPNCPHRSHDGICLYPVDDTADGCDCVTYASEVKG